MLAARIKTALILAPVILLAIFFLPAFWFSLVSLAIFMLVAWEYAHLIQLNTLIQKTIFLILLVITCIIFLMFVSVKLIFAIALVFWICAFLCVLMPENFKHIWIRVKILHWIVGIFLLATIWLAFAVLQPRPINLLILLLTVWIADSGAYFVGRKWGKHKLASKVSPGKTIEGAVGSLIFLLVWTIIINLIYFKINWYAAIVLILITGLAAIVGDLFESLIKRVHHVKDSGNILPGHGGLLDRIDSLLAAAPIYALILSMLY